MSFIEEILKELQGKLNGNTEFWKQYNTWQSFEKYVSEYFEDVCNKVNPDLVCSVIYKSGSNRFPDVVITTHDGKKYGVEVKLKTSLGGGWKTNGGSVYETSKSADFEEIYIIFGNTNLEEVRYSELYSTITDIKITHSPRYFIDMENEGDTLFTRLNITAVDPDSIIQAFKSNVSDNLEEGESLWWLDKDENLNMKLKAFKSLCKNQKKDILVEMLILFPEAFNVKASNNYDRIPEYQITKLGIYDSSLRDKFSAGGRNMYNVTSELKLSLPAVLRRMCTNSNEISFYFQMVGLSKDETNERLLKIRDSWSVLDKKYMNVEVENLESEWLVLVNKYSKEILNELHIQYTAEELFNMSRTR